MSKVLNSKNLIYLISFFIFIFLVFSYYYGIFHYNYLVPPGDDGLRHMTESNYIIETGFYKVFKGSADPPLFHIILSDLTLITNQNLVNVTKFFTPFLSILSTFSIYFITRRYFNKKLALLSLLLFTFISPQPFGIYEDGTYLNLLAAEFFLIFLLALIPRLIRFEKQNIGYNILVTIFLISVFLTHSLSTMYLIFIFSILLIILIYLKIKHKICTFKNIIFIYLVPLLALSLTWKFYLKGIYSKILKIIIPNNLSGNQSVSDSFFSIPPAFNGYVKSYSYILIILGIAGAVFLILSFVVKSQYFKIVANYFKEIQKNINFYFGKDILFNTNNLEKIIIFIWAGVLIICSRFSFFLYPSRFARDAIVPITIMSAIALYLFLNYLYKNKKSRFILVSFLLFIFLGFTISNKITNATQYHEQIRLQESDKDALEWIKNNTKSDDIFLAYPKTIAQGSWGNYIELLTNREVFDGSICPQDDDNECDPIYNPNSQVSMEFYRDNSIDYVYSGKKIMGEFVWKDLINWEYSKNLASAHFLEKVIEFEENEELGSIIIFKVNHQKLDSILKSNFK